MKKILSVLLCAVSAFLLVVSASAIDSNGTESSQNGFVMIENGNELAKDYVAPQLPDIDSTNDMSPQMILYKYSHSIEYIGEMYFPDQPFDVLYNNTSNDLNVSQTWIETASVRVVGSIDVSVESTIKAQLGFDYSFTGTYSRQISTVVSPNTSLRVYVAYATYLVTEVKMPIWTITDPSTFIISRQYIHKPVGLYYTNG